MTARTGPFPGVRTAADLDSLDDDEIMAGSRDYLTGDPEPGMNRGRAYWYGWHVAAINHGDRETDDDMRALVRAVTIRTAEGALRIVTREERATIAQQKGTTP